MRIKIPDEVAKFFKEHGSIATDGDETYYFLPFWIMEPDENNITEVHRLGNLPENLIKMIQYERNRPQQPSNTREYPRRETRNKTA